MKDNTVNDAPDNEQPDIERDKRGRFTKGQSGNPSGLTRKERQLLTMMGDDADSVAQIVIDAAKGGDMQACRLVLERVLPVRKARYEAVEFEIDDTTLAGSAKSILAAVAGGDLPPDVGAMLLQSVAQTAKIIEIDELERRIAALEKGNETE